VTLGESWREMCERSKDAGWPSEESYEKNLNAWRGYLAKLKGMERAMNSSETEKARDLRNELKVIRKKIQDDLPKSRETALVLTKLDEARMWLDEIIV
jgi:hypothetical protein